MTEKKENKFTQYPLSEEILDALEILGYKEPTEIQTEVIPLVLKGENLTAKSQTGSGKTAAFAIPLCEGVVWEENLLQALVLEPTRELTVQVKQEIFQIGRKKRLKVPDVFGGFPVDKQIQTLKQKSHIVVGTPGRVADHIRRGSLKLDKIRYLVIDEADLMLDMGFAQEVTWIIDQLPENRQMLLFSATLGPKVVDLIGTYMGKTAAEEIKSDHETVETVEQRCYRVPLQEKYDAFLTLLIKENPESCMVFCGTREMVDVLGRRMKRDGLRCGMLHGEIDQQKWAGFKTTITRLSIGGGKKSKMRAVDIVGTICSIEGIEAADIGVIDVRDSLTYVEILNGKGKLVLDKLQVKTIKGKVRKVRRKE